MPVRVHPQHAHRAGVAAAGVLSTDRFPPGTHRRDNTPHVSCSSIEPKLSRLRVEAYAGLSRCTVHDLDHLHLSQVPAHRIGRTTRYVYAAELGGSLSTAIVKLDLQARLALNIFMVLSALCWDHIA